MKQFTHKVAVVTGAASGMGRSLAIQLTAAGARVAISDVDAIGLKETARLCLGAGTEPRVDSLDVSDREAVHAYADSVASEFGTVNLVINNAGIASFGTVEESSYEDIERVINIDYWGVVHGTKAFLPYLIASGDGHVVNTSSVFGLFAVPSQSSYNAGKFAVRGFTEALRQEMMIAKHKVGVSCVHPGGIRTNIAKTSRAADPSQVDKLASQFAKVTRTSPAGAAKTILNGVRRNHARILIGADAYLIDAVPRLLGSAYQDLNVLGIRHSRYDVMVGGL